MTFHYASPISVAGVSECFFYHSMELPGIGEIKGHWDLRDVAHDYLGRVGFDGKRVLDIGAASGFLSFDMERRGAEVVSFDLDDGANWDIVPHHRLRAELPSIRTSQSNTLLRLKKAYWFSHGRLNSRARAYYGNIYALPKDLGDFDIVFYGMIVGHLRDVFEALYQGAALCRETMVITSLFNEGDEPVARFQPADGSYDNYAIKSWWGLNVGVIRRMLGVLGFQVERLVKSEALCVAPGFEGRHICTTIVANRMERSQ